MSTRKIIVWGASLVLLVAGSAGAQGKGNGAAGKPAPCTDPSLEITIVPIAGSALAGDSKGSVYTNGVDGVFNAVIHLCPSNPTYDATLGVNGSQRSIGFTFPQAIAGSIIAGPSPAWANGVQFMAKPFMNIRNILWGRMHGQATFTTRMGFGFLRGPGDKSDSNLRFMAPLADPPPDPYVPLDVNLPSDTATVTVQDIPGSCHTGGSGLDSWIVTIDPAFVGTLHKAGTGKNPDLHSGQYTMSFQLLIKAKTCLPF